MKKSNLIAILSIFGVVLFFAGNIKAQQQTVTFPCLGFPQYFSVPPGVTQITAEVVGSDGSGADPNRGGFGEAIGGKGVKLTTNITVTPGDILKVYSGCTTGYGFTRGGKGQTGYKLFFDLLFWVGTSGGGSSAILKENTVLAAAGGGGTAGLPGIFSLNSGRGGDAIAATGRGGNGIGAVPGIGGSFGGSTIPNGDGADGYIYPSSRLGGGGGGGGGIYNVGTLNLNNSTVSGNQILSNPTIGGGIHNANNGTTNLSSCTVAFNSSVFRGGGIYNDGSGTFNVENTIVAKNTAPSGGANGFGDFVSNGFNLIGNNNSITGFTNGTNNDIVGTSGVPVDPLLDPLTNNGGPTQTHALQATSPAIDKGNAGFGIVTDQRGNARFIDAPSAINLPGSNFSDIGAYEFAAPTAAAVGVSGRVLTDQKRGLRNATVILIDGEGNSRSINTGSFGYFKFSDVVVGETYVLLVRSKSFHFAPQIITVNEEVIDFNLFAESTQLKK